MRSSAKLVLIAIFAAVVFTQPPWKYCQGSDGSKIQVTGTPITPYPIKKGSPVKFQVTGTANVAISQKNCRLDVYTEGSKIFSTAVGSSYSAAAGSAYNYGFSYSIPSFVPPGNYDIWISMIDTSSNTLVCVNLAMNF